MTDAVDVTDDGRPLPPPWVAEALGGATGKGIRVAVIDSGWDRGMDEPRVLPGAGFVDPDDDFALARNDDDHDVLGHGTACADLVLRIAPDARVIPVKVFGKVLETSPDTLAAALAWAMEAGVQVINVSLGTRRKEWLGRLYLLCEQIRQAGIIIVAAGHNANDWSYPAIFENVIGVSAARFTSPFHFNYRPNDAMECQGWGVDQPVLWIGGQRLPKHGTSFAAPNVAGIVALILERYPDATLDEVRTMLARFALEVDETESDEDYADHPALPSAVPAGGTRATPAAKTPRARKAAAEKPARRAAASRGRGATADGGAESTPAKPAAKKTPARKGAAAKPAAKKSAARKSAASPPAADGGAGKKPARKPPAKQARSRKPPAKAAGAPAAARPADDIAAGTPPAKKPRARKSPARAA